MTRWSQAGTQIHTSEADRWARWKLRAGSKRQCQLSQVMENSAGTGGQDAGLTALMGGGVTVISAGIG